MLFDISAIRGRECQRGEPLGKGRMSQGDAWTHQITFVEEQQQVFVACILLEMVLQMFTARPQRISSIQYLNKHPVPLSSCTQPRLKLFGGCPTYSSHLDY